jgi:hypothetical protein
MVKVVVSPYSIKHHAIKTYGAVETEFHVFLISELEKFALTPWKDSLVPIVQEVKCAPEPVRRWWKRKIHFFTEN